MFSFPLRILCPGHNPVHPPKVLPDSSGRRRRGRGRAAFSSTASRSRTQGTSHTPRVCPRAPLPALLLDPERTGPRTSVPLQAEHSDKRVAPAVLDEGREHPAYPLLPSDTSQPNSFFQNFGLNVSRSPRAGLHCPLHTLGWGQKGCVRFISGVPQPRSKRSKAFTG